eukprot:1185420-Prorocentrum_minimum.AAC.1
MSLICAHTVDGKYFDRPDGSRVSAPSKPLASDWAEDGDGVPWSGYVEAVGRTYGYNCKAAST